MNNKFVNFSIVSCLVSSPLYTNNIKIKCLIRFRFLFITILTFNLSAAFAEQQDNWLRIDNPSAELRQQLSAVAIEYPNFLWLPENQLPDNSAIADATVHVINQPFHFNIDNQYIDLSRAQLPANDWFRDLSMTRSNDVSQLYIVQFYGPIKNEWLAALKAKNIQPIKPLAPFSWIVLAKPQQQLAMTGTSGVRNINYMYSALRVSEQNRNLEDEFFPAMALVVSEQLQQSQAELVQIGAVIQSTVSIDNNLSAINFSLSGSQYQTAAAIPGLLTIQKVDTDGGPRGEMSQQSIVGTFDASLTVQPGYQAWLTAADVDGTGVTVGVVDNGIYGNHPDLVGQMVSCTGPGPSCGNSSNSHGTHVAGAIGGTGIDNILDSGGFNRGLGVAPGVNIVEQLYIPLLGGPGGMEAGGMLSIYKDSQISGALLTNNSWGPTSTPQGYDIPTMEIDMIARDANPDIPGNQPVMPVWSIMNGGGDRPTGTCDPSSLGSPDEAKNLFAVGSTKLQNGNGSQQNALFDVSYNSAHGPACDGRLVPHIVAPGCSTDAPDNSFGYGLKCGTSMASPVISGAVSLFWEQYKNSHGVNPSSALIKAVFMAMADDLTGFNDADGNVMNHAPDRKQGWGRVNLDRIINNTDQIWSTDQQTLFANTGEQWSVQLTAYYSNEPMKIMLVWTDAPAAGLGGINPAWVNDLDLSVNSTGNLYLGNQFASDGYASTGGSADFKNNMEAVFLKPNQHLGNPISIQVMAANIMADALDPHNPTTNRQDFALVCYNCSDSPDYILSAVTDSVDICAANNANYQLNIIPTGGYTGQVSLSTTGEPSGSSTDFSVNPVTAPGGSMLTISNTSSTTTGHYPVTVHADDGINQKTADLQLIVFDQVPATTTLSLPVNGDTSVNANGISFSWGTIAEAQSYKFELASDVDFNHIIESAVVSSNSYESSLTLSTKTTYYWRVNSSNTCGASAYSSVFSFTTSKDICWNGSETIPDNDSVGIDTSLNLPDNEIITAIQVSIGSAHDYPGDLIFKLSHVNTGTSITLMNQPGVPATDFGCSVNHVDVVFDDTSVSPVEDYCAASPPGIGGNLKPDEPLSAFIGESLNGEWRLNASDVVGGGSDISLLTNFCLLPDSVPLPDLIFEDGFEGVTPP